MVRILGITGTTGSGKTTLLKVIEKLGGEVIDCDAVYHFLLGSDVELLYSLISYFGTGITSDGKLDRKRLGEIVFGNQDKLNELNSITFPFITKTVKNRIENSKKDIIAIDAPLLFESKLQCLCDKTIGVLAPLETRISRIMQRDNISEEYALKRIRSQKPDSYFVSNCDYTIINNFGSKEDFEIQSDLLLHSVLKDISS